MAYGVVSERLRMLSIEPLAECATWMDDRVKADVVTTIQKLLRDDDSRVVMAAVRALIKLKATHLYGAVNGVRGQLSNQDQVWLDNQLKSLKASGDDPALAKATKELEAMTDRVKKLEKAMEEMKLTTAKFEEFCKNAADKTSTKE
eukprot:GFYU01036276.1.p1 GENE.GFYU01036276.1~~GFYU01036276.1.p1  ORF type:complete len:146 (+),score=65.77 GFYU01036276.1:2-439(+)